MKTALQHPHVGKVVGKVGVVVMVKGEESSGHLPHWHGGGAGGGGDRGIRLSIPTPLRLSHCILYYVITNNVSSTHISYTV